MTECTQWDFGFAECGKREIVARFDGGAISSDGGAFLLRQTDRRLNLLPRLAECFLDGRNQQRVEHSVLEMLSQRVYGLALGYEDINDHEQLRNDPVFGILAGRAELEQPVAGKSTLNRLNLFLNPVQVMPEMERAMSEFSGAPGIVLDLRDNPGGLGIMAMGIAGWFVQDTGKRLGTMTGRDDTMHFIINPRLTAYSGRLAVLVNGASASTSEILAQGLQDLGRARVFGTRTAGAALPSNIIRLPNGDRFQYPEANYKSMNGRVLEGRGVTPDEIVAPTIEALLAGRDLPLETASAWCQRPPSDRQ
jgi:hypothetical protein